MDPAVLRADMVDGLSTGRRGVLEDDTLASALLAVPRHEFIEETQGAYHDRSHERLGTRVLAPGTVVRLLQALELESGCSTLIVGAGVGYTAAVAAEIVGAENVHAVDISRPVVYEARENLERAGYGGVLVDCRDGARGLREYAPFDRVLVEAAVAEPPETLERQLSSTGRLVVPRGGRPQRIVAVDHEGAVTEHDTVSLGPLLVAGEETGAVERNRTAREDTEHARKRQSPVDQQEANEADEQARDQMACERPHDSKAEVDERDRDGDEADGVEDLQRL